MPSVGAVSQNIQMMVAPPVHQQYPNAVVGGPPPNQHMSHPPPDMQQPLQFINQPGGVPQPVSTPQQLQGLPNQNNMPSHMGNQQGNMGLPQQNIGPMNNNMLPPQNNMGAPNMGPNVGIPNMQQAPQMVSFGVTVLY